jgi:phosphoglycolate phosphatase-like HAD superfamily hydrolase
MPFLSLAKLDCVFFDFDGVIADSVDAKIHAFGQLYSGFGEDVRRAVEAYQRAVPGETRYEKIPKFHREHLGITLSAEEVETWCARLSDLVLDAVVDSPLLPDVIDVLELLRGAGIPSHIVSGTPHDELAIILRRKGLSHYFRSAEGAPRRKETIVDGLLERYRLDPARCLFVGDAMTDHRCATACAIPFLGRAAPAASPFPAGTRVVERLGAAFPIHGVKLRRAA